MLDIAIMQRGGVFHLLVDGVQLLRGRHDRSPNVRYLKARGIVVETPGMPVQVDGEPHGETPMTFEVAPRALTRCSCRPASGKPAQRRQRIIETRNGRAGCAAVPVALVRLRLRRRRVLVDVELVLVPSAHELHRAVRRSCQTNDTTIFFMAFLLEPVLAAPAITRYGSGRNPSYR